MSFVLIVLVVLILAAIWWFQRRRSSSPTEPGGSEASPETQRLTQRAFVVSLLALGMLIPLGLVEGVVDERRNYYQEVIRDIASSWGGRQEIRGPFLVIPYVEEHRHTKTVTDGQGKTTLTETPSYTQHYAWLLPDVLDVDVALDPEARRRGIYESLVYNADLSLSGRFSRPDFRQLSNTRHRVEWEKASLVVLLSSVRSLDDVAPLRFAGREIDWQSGVSQPIALDTGFHAPISLTPRTGSSPEAADSEPETFEFDIQLDLRGSEGLYFASMGRDTTAEIRSSWTDPSFQGPILPTDHTVDDSGFVARWDIPQLARDYPQFGVLEAGASVSQEVFVTGVRLFEPVSLYSLVKRSAKYGVLFIVLTYVTFLVFELQIAARLHYVQYGLIGAALALFFLTLLSLSEHVGFARAYGLAAGIAILLVAGYTAASLRRAGPAITVAVMLTALYGLLFTILHLVDFALLMGTGLLTLVLVILMAVTRNLGRPTLARPTAPASPEVAVTS